MDFTWLMRMYRDRHGRAVARTGSVLTRSDGSAPELEDARQAIVAFSTIAWLAGTPSADAWVFDLWTVPRGAKRNAPFLRSGKFTTNLTDPTVERIYPTPYSSPITLGPFIPQQLVGFLEGELSRGNESSALRALSQMHEVRFETPYQTSPGNDLEALWTGYEALYLPRGPPAQPSELGLIDRLLGLLLSPRPKHLRRSERLVQAIHLQLAGIPGIRQEVQDGAAELIEKLWAARNAHSHGGEVHPPARIERLESSVWYPGLTLFEALLRIRVARQAGDDIFFLPAAVDQLNEIFLRRPTYAAVVAGLANLDAKEWYRGLGSRRADLERLNGHLRDFVSFKRVDGWANQRDVAKACGFMRRVLSAWANDLALSDAQGDDIAAIVQFRDLDSTTLKDLKARGKRGAELDAALDSELVQYVKDSEVHRASDPDLGWRTGALPLGGVIPLWLWARAYIRLFELYIGFALI